ncbi:putative F-box/FBD/LRR-repeat protein At4g03220 [Malus sylvestris]|uniref:putative F-box/FBD/LRR-repeat protein At4g03220 n=1 Tax=Malus domestica TaxID=3750 RepID=UPI0010AA6FA4|nr:putative F-box/FBD/LRR-repeat protein At4g03220 [Malus domestica]XP_050138046.1 putative F-box/FBD/LRR-repeat protein At4g03220 [Malus sylvestris]
MEARAKGGRLSEEVELHTEGSSRNRISSLPDDILHHILSLLPVGSTAQTSVLSRQWNHLWASLPILDFSDVKGGAVEFISKVLRHRHENSNLKVFRVKGYLSSSCLYSCIDRVVKYRVEELALDVSLTDKYFSGDAFGLPSLFKCDSLRSLTLATYKNPYYSPSIPKPHFGLLLSSNAVAKSGLHQLHTLSLTRVEFLDSALELDLFSASSLPSLEKLSITNCKGITHLKITCPNIKDVHIIRMFLSSLDISGMRLENLEITHCFEVMVNGNRVKIFALNLKTFWWQHNYCTEESFAPSFPILRACHLACFSKVVDVTMVKPTINLLCGSSQVQKLCIYDSYLRTWHNILLDDAGCTEEQFWESQAQILSHFLCHLKVVNIHDYSHRINENVIKFARFLLEHGRSLQEIILHSRHPSGKEKIGSVLEGFLEHLPVSKSRLLWLLVLNFPMRATQRN